MQRCASKLLNISNHSRGRRWQAAVDELDEAETAGTVKLFLIRGHPNAYILYDSGACL